MTRISMSAVLVCALVFCVGCDDEENAEPTETVDTEDEATTAPAEASEAQAAATETAEPAPAIAQSTGSQTELVEGENSRNTLIDREIGIQITCPVDRTWRCTLGGDGMWSLRDMSSNRLTVQVLGASDVAGALEAEIALVREELPVTEVASQEGSTAVLNIGPNPEWSSPVDRRAWIQVKQIGERYYACRGVGSEGNYENSRGDYEQMCESLSAVE